MLSNLQEIQKQMRQLINEINQLQKQISNPYQAKKSNSRNSILLKIPKYLLLNRVVRYLTFPQCHILSQTCVILHRSIYSPLGWKFLSYSHSPYKTILVDPSSNLSFHKKQSSSEFDKFQQDYDDQEFLIRQRVKYNQVLWTRFKQYCALKQKNQVLQQKVNIQKIYLFRKILENTYFTNESQYLKDQTQKYKNSLKRLTNDFLSKDQKLQQRINQVEMQNIKLQKQKQALVGKIRQYQQQMPRANQQAEDSKKTLNCIKDFLNNQKLQPLKDIIEDQ